MKGTQIKICGLSSVDDVQSAAMLGADFLGFVFCEHSPRNISLDQAAKLGSIAHTLRKTKVAVTVDASDQVLNDIYQALSPDFFQLHGVESEARIDAIKRRFGLPVIKAKSIVSAEDVQKIQNDKSSADMLLFDAKAPKGSKIPGGNGVAFNWALLNPLNVRQPWILSGGLNPDNVASAIKKTNARFVDVSSGVESSPGIKESNLIKQFIEEVRRVSI